MPEVYILSYFEFLTSGLTQWFDVQEFTYQVKGILAEEKKWRNGRKKCSWWRAADVKLAMSGGSTNFIWLGRCEKSLQRHLRSSCLKDEKSVCPLPSSSNWLGAAVEGRQNGILVWRQTGGIHMVRSEGYSLHTHIHHSPAFPKPLNTCELIFLLAKWGSQSSGLGKSSTFYQRINRSH